MVSSERTYTLPDSRTFTPTPTDRSGLVVKCQDESNLDVLHEGDVVKTTHISSTVAAADYHQISDADWSIQIFF